MLCTLPASIITGRILRKGVSFRTLVLIGWATLLVGDALVIIWYTNTPAVAWAIIQMLVGIGQVSRCNREITTQMLWERAEANFAQAGVLLRECDAPQSCLMLTFHLNRV